MQRINTYHLIPESTVLNHLTGQYENLPNESTKEQPTIETQKKQAYGHTQADVEQQILDWLKAPNN